MTACRRGSVLVLLLTFSAAALTGCGHGISQNPSYFPYLWPTGDIIRTHAKPHGHGYYANFDPYAASLKVEPKTQVVPVQTQLVIAATVIDPKGDPLRSRRVEWTVQGVGDIVEVDESGFWPGRGYKVDHKHAVSYTDYHSHRLTRGNTDPRDDFEIRPGQSWCVISSAVEGDTYVKVMAPGIANWDKRIVVVNYRWVDVEWQFPEPAQVRTGARHVFTTRIFRHTDKQPLANYKVRYRIVGGPPAVLLPSQAQEDVVVSDLNGNAQIAIAQQAPLQGINNVEVEIIRPPDPTKPSGSGVTVAKGVTTIEWLAPNINLSVTGPQTAPVGQELAYTIAVRNTGKIAAQAMLVTNPVPDGLKYVRANPPAVLEGGNLVWTLGKLDAGREHPSIQVFYQAIRPGTVQNCATVTTQEGQKAEDCAVTEITEPRVQLSVTGPQAGVVGVPITFDVRVSNVGTGPITNALVRATLSDGLEPQGLKPGQENLRTVTSEIAAINAQQIQNIPLTVVPRREGAQLVTVTVEADGNLRASGRANVTISQPRVAINITGPKSRYTDRSAEWNITVANPSDVPLENVVVRDKLPPGLTFDNATGGGAVQNGEVVWNVGLLGAGEQKVVQLTTRCGGAPGFVNHTAIVSSGFGLSEKATAQMEILALPAALKLELIDVGDPVNIGDRMVYEIEVTNTGAKPAKQVQIVARVPAEMKVVAAQGTTEGTKQNQFVTFGKVPILQPGQKARYTLQVEAVKAGDVRFEAQLRADLLPQPVTETESTTIVDTRPAAGGSPRPPAPSSVRGGNSDNTPVLRRPIVLPVAPPPAP